MAKNELKMKTITIQVRTTATNKELKAINTLYFADSKFLMPLDKGSKKRVDLAGILQVSVQDDTQ